MFNILPDRFWDKIMPEPNSGCWLWDASVNQKGYGQFWFAGKMKKAHKVAYEAFIGKVPSGYNLDHLCRIRSCVNPHHLEAVTPGENVRRGVHHNSLKTECVNGHELSDDNVYIRPNGWRECRLCRKRKMEVFSRTKSPLQPRHMR